ncbi:hypothetical protein FKM82_017664, partial [Ascaphus truei]
LFSAQDADGCFLLSADGFSSILRSLLGTPAADNSKVYTELCAHSDACGLTREEFLGFALHHPRYRHLFLFYMRPPAAGRRKPPRAPQNGGCAGKSTPGNRGKSD